MRTCKSCGNEKPLADFYRQPSGGFMGRCKECVKKRARQYRRDNLDRVKEYDRGRSFDPDRVETRKRVAQQRRLDPDKHAADLTHSREWYQRNKEKKRANVIVKRAIEAGALAVKPCERCGDGIGVQAHHEDYSRPLDVIWLCPPCHGERHREINAERRRKAG